MNETVKPLSSLEELAQTMLDDGDSYVASYGRLLVDLLTADPTPEPVVTFTALADDSRLVLHKVRIDGRIQVDGERFADGSGITDCHYNPWPHPLPDANEET